MQNAAGSQLSARRATRVSRLPAALSGGLLTFSTRIPNSHSSSFQGVIVSCLANPQALLNKNFIAKGRRGVCQAKP